MCVCGCGCGCVWASGQHQSCQASHLESEKRWEKRRGAYGAQLEREEEEKEGEEEEDMESVKGRRNKG